MDQVNLEIGNLETLITFIENAKKVGLLKDISTNQVKVSFSKMTFPIHIPVDLNGVIAIVGKPILKPFGKQIEKKTVDILNKVLSPAE